MANYADSEAGRVTAEDWAKAKVADGTWLVAHRSLTITGNVAVRFLRPISAANPEYGGWNESRDDAAT